MQVRTVDNEIKGKFHSLHLIKNGEKNPISYGGSEKLPISFLETYNLLVNSSQVLIKDDDGEYYDVLHSNSELEVKLDSGVVTKVKKGNPAVVGDNLNIKQSPAPLCYVDNTGAINSVVASDSIWSESVMGYTAEGKPDTYSQGFVRRGSAEHGGFFLRKDGQWGQPSIYTGSVAENFLSLQDTPVEYTNHIDQYLRVSYAEGGSIVFDAIDTSKVPEAEAHLYYTEARVENKLIEKTTDRSLTNLLVRNTITANDFVCDSDCRLKYDIEDLHGSIEKVAQLKPKSYKFKGKSKTRFGLISQEVQKIFPELVSDAPHDYQTMNYLDLIPHLVGCIQNLTQRIELLEKERGIKKELKV
jgi:hypothetical protein